MRSSNRRVPGPDRERGRRPRSARRSLRSAFVAALAAVGFFVANQGVAHAALELLTPNPSVPATFVGKGGYSADGLGQNEPGGTVQAEVPAGSTVRHAFLYGTYFNNATPDEAARTIDFDGTNVVLEFLPNSEPACCGLATARATVTSQVAAKVGGGGGITDFAINNDPSSLDGVGLVVIYENPSSPDGTIAVLDGGSDPAGDTTVFELAGPLDTSTPGFAAQMSLGSGFSFQGPAGSACGGGQFSTVEVNGSLLTGCAGNYDDGVGNNGGLITVGGVGDSTNNPDPPDAPAEDDELYDLVPFLSSGDTEIVVDTANPSTDDNLFLAVISFTARVEGTVEICDNGADEDGDGLVDLDDPDCPTAGTEEGCPFAIDGTTFQGDGTDETILGTPRNDRLNGGAGNDNIDALQGDDCINGEDGDDQLTGSDGNDQIRGDAGSDVAAGGLGDDDIEGGIDGDNLDGNDGDDKVIGRGSNDDVNGGTGNDTLRGSGGEDNVDGGENKDRVQGGTDDDKVKGGPGKDLVRGVGGDDKVVGGSGRDKIRAGGGDDKVNAVDGTRDHVKCGLGDDVAKVDAKDKVVGDCDKVIVKKKK